MGSLVKTNRAMKTILFLCLSVVSIKALVLPLPLKFGGNKSPTLKSIETCPGHENDVMVVIEGTTDEEICMPGNSTINVHTRVSEDLPMDLVIKMDLQKVTAFPEYQPCSCPLLKGEFILEGVQTPVQDMGPILGAVMEGEYDAPATLYGASDKDRILGCMKLT